MYPAHIYYYTYHVGNFSQVARKMSLVGARAKAGRTRASLAPLGVILSFVDGYIVP